MNIYSTLDQIHARAKQNSWHWLFSIFCRLALALGFIPAAIVKLVDERFASGLHAKHPMGYYLEALHYSTGYYYTFIGVAQIAAAIFLLIPRAATLGAFIYFPIILNITVLTYATRFDGSFFTAPLMTLANLYILGWNYEKWKFIMPFYRFDNHTTGGENAEGGVQTGEGSRFSRYGIRSLATRLRPFIKRLRSDKFPALFFAGVFATVVFFAMIVPRLYLIMPRNTFERCQRQFSDTNRTKAGAVFCGCIHEKGEPLNKCLTQYDNAPDDTDQTR